MIFIIFFLNVYGGGHLILVRVQQVETAELSFKLYIYLLK